MKCWLCDEETGLKDTDYGDYTCPKCGVLISIYNPNCTYQDEATEKPKTTESEWLSEGGDMILGGKFLKAEDCQQGDVIEFIDEGIWAETRFENEDGTKKQQCQFQIKHNDEEKTLGLNKTNRETLIASWGRDTAKWVGKKAEIILKEVEVAGEDKVVIRLKAL